MEAGEGYIGPAYGQGREKLRSKNLIIQTSHSNGASSVVPFPHL